MTAKKFREEVRRFCQARQGVCTGCLLHDNIACFAEIVDGVSQIIKDVIKKRGKARWIRWGGLVLKIKEKQRR